MIKITHFGGRVALVVVGILAITTLTPAYAAASNIYVAQSATGSADGSGCANAYAYTFFNDSSNWGSGASQIGPGTTVHICGTITAPQSTTATILTFQGSGTSGNPITLKFEPGAVITSPAFYEGIHDFQNYTVIDGGTNGIIQNTNNGAAGTGKTYDQGSQAVNISGSNITVQNLTIQNLCIIHAGTSDSDAFCGTGSWGSTGIGCQTSPSCSNVTITKNTLNLPGDTGIAFSNDDSNLTISYNTITGVNFGIEGWSQGDSSNNSGYYILGNDISCTVGAACVWDDPGDQWHHDGIILFPSAGGGTETMHNVVIANNYIHDFNSSSNGSICGGGGGCTTADIFIDPAGNGSLPGLQIYNNVLTSDASLSEPSNGAIAVGNSNSASYTAFVYNNTAAYCGLSGFAIYYSGTKAENNIVSSCNQYGWSADALASTTQRRDGRL